MIDVRPVYLGVLKGWFLMQRGRKASFLLSRIALGPRKGRLVKKITLQDNVQWLISEGIEDVEVVSRVREALRVAPVWDIVPADSELSQIGPDRNLVTSIDR